MNAGAVVDGVRAVAAKVQDALRAGELPLVLGGDCTVGVGTVAGAVAAGADPRLVYLDLHPDLNTPGSVPDGALDWMGVAHMLDVEGADERLAGRRAAAPAAARRRPRAARHRARRSAPRPSATRSPPATCGRSASTTLRADPARGRRARRSSGPRAGGRRFLVHFDVDVIDFSDVPLSENTGRGIGVGVRGGAGGARASCSPHDALLGLTVTELNPHHGAQDGADVARLARALAGALRARR